MTIIWLSRICRLALFFIIWRLSTGPIVHQFHIQIRASKQLFKLKGAWPKVQVFWASHKNLELYILSTLLCNVKTIGLTLTGHMSFLTGQDRTPKFAGQVCQTGLIFLNILHTKSQIFIEIHQIEMSSL